MGFHGIKEICNSANKSRVLKILDFSYNMVKITMDVPFPEIIVEELFMSHCLTENNGICNIYGHLLRVLDLSFSRMTETVTSDFLASLFICNPLLESLFLRYCDLLPQHVDIITSHLQKNSKNTLKVLDLSENKQLTSQCIVHLISTTQLTALNVQECFLNADDMCGVAMAVCRNKSLEILVCGECGYMTDPDEKREGWIRSNNAFLETLGSLYPRNGPLDMLFMNGYVGTDELRSAEVKLQEKLHRLKRLIYRGIWVKCH